MINPLALVFLSLIIGLADPDVEVISSSENSYQITGRFWLTEQTSTADGVARKAAVCVNCKWHLQQVCADPITQQVDAGFDCTNSASYRCSGGGRRYQVWFLDAGLWRPSDWQLRGTSCIGSAGPKPIRDVQQEIIDSAVGYLPELKFNLKPSNNSLVNLPTKVKVTSPSKFSFQTVVAGVAVQVTATATYRYLFQDGTTISTTATEVSHVYRKRGNYPIAVIASWQAIWSTPLHGSNPVAGSDLTQQKTKVASVVAARGRLIKR